MSRVVLRCANAVFGVAIDASGTIDVICDATRCRSSDGVTHHKFDAQTGAYETDIEAYRHPRELRGLPGVREVKRDGTRTR